tara:strand:+ start:4260 stop:4463 length:204 start_codon:yes stop_codon:yes gene_type:complete
MLRDYEKGDVVRYGPTYTDHHRLGLVVDVEYHVKPDDFLIFIMWPAADRPQALFQKDCHNRGLKVLD